MQNHASTRGAAQGASGGGAGKSRPASRRRPGHVNLGQLQEGTLRKYGRYFNLEEVSNGTKNSKDDLLPAVTKHFSSQVIRDEQDTLMQFILSLRKRKLLDDSTPLIPNGTKKQRTSSKRAK